MKCKYCGEFYDSSLAHSHKCSPFERDELKRALDKASAPMTTPPLPSWPERSVYKANDFGRRAYRAEAYDAAMARLRSLYTAAWDVSYSVTSAEGLLRHIAELRKIVATIGDLPPPVDDLPQQQRTGE